jgi:hypothetical protein
MGRMGENLLFTSIEEANSSLQCAIKNGGAEEVLLEIAQCFVLMKNLEEKSRRKMLGNHGS